MAENIQYTQGLPEGKILSQEIVTETVLTEEELQKRGLIGQGFYGQAGNFAQATPVVVNTTGTAQTGIAQQYGQQVNTTTHTQATPVVVNTTESFQTGIAQQHGHPVKTTTHTQETIVQSVNTKQQQHHHHHDQHQHQHHHAGAVGAGALGAGVIGAGVAGTHAGTHGTHGTHALGSDYKGTFVFKPLEGKFNKDKDIVGKMDPYIKIKIGWHSGKSSVAKSEGTHPTWNDVIPLEKKHHEEFAKIKIKDKDRLTLNDKIGEAKIPLAEIAAKGHVQQWFPVYKKDQITGEILLDVTFQPRAVI